MIVLSNEQIKRIKERLKTYIDIVDNKNSILNISHTFSKKDDKYLIMVYATKDKNDKPLLLKNDKYICKRIMTYHNIKWYIHIFARNTKQT